MEISPPIHCRAGDPGGRVPEGPLDRIRPQYSAQDKFKRPSGTPLSCGINPAMNRRATLKCPYGTPPNSQLSHDEGVGQFLF
jgi:hypothetical protein